MKKIILFMTILLGVSAESYSAIKNQDEKDINRSVTKELTKLYGGYKNIYIDGIDKNNINFILNEIKDEDLPRKKYDFSDLFDEEVINLNLSQGIELKKITKIKKLKIIEKPHKNSTVNLKKENKSLKIDLSSAGTYKISFTNEDMTIKVITFVKGDDFRPQYENVYENIKNSYSENNVEFLNDNLLLLKNYFPDSPGVKESLFYAIELNEQIKNYEVIKTIVKILSDKYDINEVEKEQLIEVYLDALNQTGEEDEYLSFLKKLSDYDEKYEDQYLKGSIKYKNYDLKAVELAKKVVLFEGNPEIINYLGDYYYKQKNYKMAIYYYEQTESVDKLSSIYLITGEKENYKTLKLIATPEELIQMKKVEDKYIEEQKLEIYIKKAEKYKKEGRYQEAELYYKKPLKSDISSELRSKIYYKLVDLYYYLHEYQEAKKNFELINYKDLDDEDLSNYYYLGGMIDYKLEDYDKSLKYFNVLVDKFPKSSISNKAKIYILKIDKLKQNKLEKEVEDESSN